MTPSRLVAMGLTLLAIALSPAVAQECLTPPAGVLSWWPGDGTAEDLVGGRHGTLMLAFTA